MITEKEKNKPTFVYHIILKECGKKHKLHQVNYDLWTVKKDMLFIFQDIYLCDRWELRWAFKPLYSDELLWRIHETKYSLETWEDFKKNGTSRRVNGIFVAPAKVIYTCTHETFIAEEECRDFYEAKISEFLEMIETVKESDYVTDTELSMINILEAIHRKDYKRAKKLTKQIKDYLNPFKKRPHRINPRPEEEILYHEDYILMKKAIRKYLRKTKLGNA